MELSTVTKAARLETKNYYGSEEVSMAAGKTIRVETSPAGEEILDMTVPEGKAWSVSVTISIAEVSI